MLEKWKVRDSLRNMIKKYNGSIVSLEETHDSVNILLTEFMGDSISSLDSISYADGILSISNCIFTVDGHFIKNEGTITMELANEETAYLRVETHIVPADETELVPETEYYTISLVNYNTEEDNCKFVIIGTVKSDKFVSSIKESSLGGGGDGTVSFTEDECGEDDDWKEDGTKVKIKQLFNGIAKLKFYPLTTLKAVIDPKSKKTLDEELFIGEEDEEFVNPVGSRDADTLGGKWTANDIQIIKSKADEIGECKTNISSVSDKLTKDTREINTKLSSQSEQLAELYKTALELGEEYLISEFSSSIRALDPGEHAEMSIPNETGYTVVSVDVMFVCARVILGEVDESLEDVDTSVFSITHKWGWNSSKTVMYRKLWVSNVSNKTSSEVPVQVKVIYKKNKS